MVERTVLESDALSNLAAEVARGLSYVGTSGSATAAFIVTPIMYANGSHVVCRITPHAGGYEVSDNGEGAVVADGMGLAGGYAKAAAFVSARGGAEFGERTFFISKVRREQLVGAIAYVANASSQTIERLIYTQENEKVSKTRQVFEMRIRQAFGQDALRNREVRGATSTWRFDAVVRRSDGLVQTVFEFIAPQYSAVASSFMKLNNLRALADGPKAIAVLADYERTAPELRSTLSLASDQLIPADASAERYQEAA